MIRGIQGRGEAHAAVGIAHAHQGLAIGHHRKAEPAGRDASAGPAAIVTLSREGRALAQQALAAERGQGLGQRVKGAKRLLASLPSAPGGATPSAGVGGAADASGAIATRRPIPRGIAKKLATSLSVGAAAPAASLTSGSATAAPATRLPLAEAETATAPTRRPTRGPAWGHLIRQGGFDAGGQGTATAPATASAERPETKRNAGMSALHETDSRQSARALMQAAAARLVAEARSRRDDQKAELAAGPEREAAEQARAPHEQAQGPAASRAPHAASTAVAAAAEQAGLALSVPETNQP